MLAPSTGLTEILTESQTADGFVNPSLYNPTHAKFGLAPYGVHVARANMMGVSTVIVAPRARGPVVTSRMAIGGFIKGVSTAFYTGIKHGTYPGAGLSRYMLKSSGR